MWYLFCFSLKENPVSPTYVVGKEILFFLRQGLRMIRLPQSWGYNMHAQPGVCIYLYVLLERGFFFFFFLVGGLRFEHRASHL
jgi:hypothetical protein